MSGLTWLPVMATRSGCATLPIPSSSTAAAWRNALPHLSPQNRAIAEPYAAWLAQFHHYAEAAPAKGRPIPDLIVVYRAEAG